MSAPRARGVRSAVGALAAAAPLACASAAPWLVQPSVSVGSEYQSNPALQARDGSATTQGSLSLALPASWQDGRYTVALSAGAQLRRARGNDDSDTSDLNVDASLERAGERASVQARVGYAERNLLGLDAPDAGLVRAPGSEHSWSGGVDVRWSVGELDSLGLSVNERRFRYSSPTLALVGSDEANAALTYGRALSERLQLLFVAGAAEFRPENDAGRSRSYSAQAGFLFRPSELWSLRAVGGRSRLQSDLSGLSVPGSVYSVDVVRRTELGSLTFAAAQSFSSSVFGTVAKRRDFSLSYGRPLAPRLSGSVALRRTAEREVFRGFDLVERRADDARLEFAYALSETWSCSLGAGWRRAGYPATAFAQRQPSASSYSFTLSVGRRFGTVTL